MGRKSMRGKKVQKEERVLFNRKDIVLCVLLMFVSTIMTFNNLGDTRFPTSAYYGEEEQPIIIEFGQTITFQGIMYLNGENCNQEFGVLFLNDKEEWELCYEENTADKAFRWSGFGLEVTTKYFMIVPGTPELSILEAAFYSDGICIMPTGYSSAEAAALFDEPELVPEYPFFTNSMYFDESVHALTAYEFINGKPPTERTHPPLGKSIIALGIDMFGMSPFGWRFMSALFGVLLIIPLYVLAKFMLGARDLSFLAVLIFTFDFMRFVQSRLANIDIFLVTFITLMYLFMYKYIQTNPEDRLNRKALLYLGFSGAFMGLAVAVKWSAAFAGLGLGVLFVLAWYEAKSSYGEYHPNANSKPDVPKYKVALTKTVVWCVLFFGIVPIIIYCLSYIPFSIASGFRWPNCIIQNQIEMFSFHAYLEDTHEYMSNWWSWPLDLRPMNYSNVALPNGTAGGMITFGNPALWWGGLSALIWCAVRWFSHKDKPAMFLCIAWIAQILPWVFITRSSFIYHYFPCVPFLALMIVYYIKTRPKRHRWRFALVFAALTLAMFVVFYPVLGGMPISNLNYIKSLQWLPGWQFIK